MFRYRRARLLAGVSGLFLAGSMLAATSVIASSVQEATADFEHTANLRPQGYSERIPLGTGDFNTDLAFRGKYVFQGHYTGFRVIDIADPEAPVEIVDVDDCGVSLTSGVGQQGDIVVWDNILVRSWDGTAGGACQGLPGVSGLHVFDISDLANPVAVGFVNLPNGSHTATGVPDLENNRLLVYSSPSSAARPGIDIVQVPLHAPWDVELLKFLPSGGASPQLTNRVTIDAPSPAAGVYPAAGASFGPGTPLAGVAGNVVLVNSGGSDPTEGCGPLIGFPAGAIALADRGSCSFVDKAMHAQAAGAVALIVVNNVAGTPTTLGGDGPGVTIPSVHVGQADGNAIKAGLPATGEVSLDTTPAARACHDTGVILGDAMLAACAGGDGFAVWSMHPDDGGTLDTPVLLYGRSVPGVTIGHSAAFSWDGEILVFGHEPGGGGQPQCQESSPEVNRTLFFFEARTGEELGRHVLPRPQSAGENCTIHNYNVIPTGRARILVHGSYQSGIGVVDFSDPANAVEIAFADPAPLDPPMLGGDWSSYWYNGRIYESDIRRGLIIWNLNDPRAAGVKPLQHLNPQTQEFTIPFRGTAHGRGGKVPAK